MIKEEDETEEAPKETGETEGQDGGEDAGGEEKSTIQVSDLKEEDIEIVMSHTNCSREDAISALQKAGGDSVKVILDMTQE